MTRTTRKIIQAVVEPAIVRWAERERIRRGDLFATEHEMENIRTEPLAYSDMLSGEDAKDFLRQIFEAADTEPLYACDACAREIDKGGVSDDEGHLVLNGRTGTFYVLCALCAAPATHEVEHSQEAE